MIAEEEEDAATPVEEIQDELYGQLTSEVVGIRHYRGLVGPGEEVRVIAIHGATAIVAPVPPHPSD